MDNNKALHEIFLNVLKGRVYGYTARGPRWAYFQNVLYLVNDMHNDDIYIGYNHYGSSAIECDLDKLEWLITTIFNITPAEFLQRYESR